MKNIKKGLYAPHILGAITFTSLYMGNAQANYAPAHPELINGNASYVAAGGDYIAYLQLESANRTDLNGDGDFSDTVLHLYNTQTNVTTNTGIATYAFRIETDGETVVFMQRERNVSEDLTGDGDQLDVVLAHYDIANGQASYTSVIPYINTGQAGGLRSYGVDGNIITFQSRESGRTDYNGDGDMDDAVIRYLDTSNGSVHNTPLTSTYAVISDGIIASRVSEYSSLDFNQDGDLNDNVIVLFDTNNGDLQSVFSTYQFNLTSPTTVVTLDGNHLYFRVKENDLGMDLNNDGRISYDNAIMRYELDSGQFSSTGIINSSDEIIARGERLAFQISEYELQIDVNDDGNFRDDRVLVLHDTSDDSNQYLVAGGNYSLSHDSLAVSQWEGRIRTDVNNDGDTSDRFVYRVATGQEPPQVSCRINSIDCRIQDVADLISSWSHVTAFDKQSLIDELENAINVFRDSSLEEFHRYNGTIDVLDNFFAVLWPLSHGPISYEDALELESLVRPIKDELHDLRDASVAHEEDSDNNNDGPSIESQLGALYDILSDSNAVSDAQVQAALLAPVESNFALGAAMQAGSITPADAISQASTHLQTLQSLLAQALSDGDIQQEAFDTVINIVDTLLNALSQQPE